MKKTLLLALFLFSLAVPALALDLGDSAPEISPETWITGEPADPTKTDDKTFYLVEVWSVTCPPCVRSIPIMNELQKRYADQGFKIVSFTTDTEDEVKEFLDDHPMEYSSFIDKEGETMIRYMAADNRNTIPHAFLFDKSGALVWIGNPLDNLEARVKEVLSGKLNRERAVAVRDAKEGLQVAFESQNIEGMLSSLKELEDLEPDNSQYYQLHYRIMTELGFGDDTDIRDLFAAWYEGSKDQAESLAILSMVAMDQGPASQRNPELALAAAKRSFELDSPAQIKVQAGLNLADVYKAIGRIDLALDTLKETSKIAESDQMGTISDIEDFYLRMKKLGENPDAEYKP